MEAIDNVKAVFLPCGYFMPEAAVTFSFAVDHN